MMLAEIEIDDLDDVLGDFAIRAQKAIATKDYHYALEVLHPLLAQKPGCLELRFLLEEAREKYVLQKSAARRWLDKLLSLKYRIWLLFFWKKKPYQALEMMERLRDSFPGNIKIERKLGKLAQMLGLKKTALHLYEKVCERDPSHVEGLLDLAEAWLESGHMENAQKIALLAYRFSPGNIRTETVAQKVTVAAMSRSKVCV